MRLCLSCQRLWPREAQFCGRCGRSFGGRLCPSRHLSPATAHVCVQCGKDELTEATAFLSLGCVSSLVSACVLFLAWKWVWHHLELVFTGVLNAINAALRLLFDLPPHALERFAGQAIGWTVCVVVVLHLLPGRTGRDVRRAVYGSARRLGQLACGLIAVQLLRRLVAACRRNRRTP